MSHWDRTPPPFSFLVLDCIGFMNFPHAQFQNDYDVKKSKRNDVKKSKRIES